MEELIQQFITNYLPAVGSCSLTVIALKIAISQIKEIAKNKIKDTTLLQDSIKNISNHNEIVEKVISENVEELKNNLIILAEQNKNLKIEVESLKYCIGQNQEIIKQNTTLKNQLSVLLREEQADGKN